MATGSRIDFSLLPHLAINLRHSLVCPITDSRWLSLYNLWKPTRSRTRHRWSARHARQRHVDGPAIPRLSIMWLRSVTVLNWRADIRREGGEDNAGFRTGRMNTDWFVIIPGFHCTEGSGSSWLLCVEVKGRLWACLYTRMCPLPFQTRLLLDETFCCEILAFYLARGKQTCLPSSLCAWKSRKVWGSCRGINADDEHRYWPL